MSRRRSSARVLSVLPIICFSVVSSAFAIPNLESAVDGVRATSGTAIEEMPTPVPPEVATEAPAATPAEPPSVVPTATPLPANTVGISVPVAIPGGTGIVGISNPKVDSEKQCTVESTTRSGNASVDVSLTGQYGPVELGDFGVLPRRHHWVYMNATVAAASRLTVDGRLTGTTTEWSGRVTGGGSGTVSAQILVWQQFQRGRSMTTHTVATATVVGDFIFSDSLTASRNCAGNGQIQISTGIPTVTVTARLTAFDFHGLVAPNLQGPVVSRIRRQIERAVTDAANTRLQGLVDARVLQATANYQNSKAGLLQTLQSRLPVGCSCPTIGTR